MSASADHTSSLLEGSAPKRLAAFSAPLIAANLLQYVYQFVDMGVVGNIVGETGLVAISNASVIVFIISSIAIGLMSGCTVAVGNRVGARDEQGQRHAFAASIGVALLGAAATTLAGTALAHPIFSLMGVPDASLVQTAAYLEVISLGAVGLFLLNAACAFLRAQGDSLGPLAIMAFSAVANVILDFALIAGAGLGVVGAAIATVAAQGAGAVFALWLARRRYASARSVLRSMREARERGKAIAAARDVLRVGAPMAAQQAVINLSYVLVTAWLNSYGPTIAAASGVGLKISTIAGLPCWGVGQAVSAAVSQSIGAGMPERAVAFAKSGCLMAIAVTVCIQIVVQLGPEWLVSLFGESSRELIDAAVLYLRITCSVNGIFYASMYALDSFALASGAPKLALANSLIDAFAMRAGLAWILSAPLGCGFIGIYAAQAAAPVLPAVVGFVYLQLWARRNLSR
ncbi:MATE family efflux transporter [Enterorhabdus sp. P55]|uniref:MATE family efflux transporter n=1 Tax=Enterorhabdus sp. P55 TaxID=2304571 RepID=UPI001367AE93|nr:MATE family efflux transporter [Enterorhabdus sp. P55]NBI31706.1 MATE family efflux transporter [Enterorhabdus sp. P55]